MPRWHWRRAASITGRHRVIRQKRNPHRHPARVEEHGRRVGAGVGHGAQGLREAGGVGAITAAPDGRQRRRTQRIGAQEALVQGGRRRLCQQCRDAFRGGGRGIGPAAGGRRGVGHAGVNGAQPALAAAHPLDGIEDRAFGVEEHQVAVLPHRLQHQAHLRLRVAEGEAQHPVEPNLPRRDQDGALQVLAQQHAEGRRPTPVGGGAGWLVDRRWRHGRRGWESRLVWRGRPAGWEEVGAGVASMDRQQEMAVPAASPEGEHDRLCLGLQHLLHLPAGAGVDLRGHRRHPHAVEAHCRWPTPSARHRCWRR